MAKVVGALLLLLGLLLGGLRLLPIGAADGEQAATVPRGRAGLFASRAGCEAYLRAHPRPAERPPRIGTWNVRWFPLGTPKGDDPDRRTDVRWLACTIAGMEVDVLGVQEFLLRPAGRAALLDLQDRLDELTGGRWQARLDDCPDGNQHVGLLYDASRVTLESHRALASLNPGEGACHHSLRPGLAAYLRFHGGPDLHVVVVHLDSGRSQRDFDNRATSARRLQRALAGLKPRDDDVIVLGDFNAMGCSKCGGGRSAEQELAGLDGAAARAGLRRVPFAAGLGCTEYYRGRPGVLDLIYASEGSAAVTATAEVLPRGPCRQLGCRRLSRGAPPPPALERLSDHCPLLLELAPGDRD